MERVDIVKVLILSTGPSWATKVKGKEGKESRCPGINRLRKCDFFEIIF